MAYAAILARVPSVDHLPTPLDAHRANPSDKIPFHHQLPDLRVQLLDLGVACGPGRFARAGEGRSHAVDRLPLPRRDHRRVTYAIQSPFTGELHYPLDTRHRAFEKATMRKWLGGWGSIYEERELGYGKPKALVIKGAPTRRDPNFSRDQPALVAAREAAEIRSVAGDWPKLYSGVKGDAQPMLKVPASHVKSGSVPTFWMDEADPDRLESIGAVSFPVVTQRSPNWKWAAADGDALPYKPLTSQYMPG